MKIYPERKASLIYLSLEDQKQFNLTKGDTEGFVNYRGITSDTKEKYTEVIASHLLEQLERLKQIDPVERTDSYKVSRKGTTPREADGRKWEQEEQRIAMKLFNNKTLQLFSKILHYQTPLGDGRGAAIDLLARDTDSVYILELKRPESKETLLRCVLEVHAYFCMLDHEKLLRISRSKIIRHYVKVYLSLKIAGHIPFTDHKIRLLMRELEIDFFVLNEDANQILETHYFNEI